MTVASSAAPESLVAALPIPTNGAADAAPGAPGPAARVPAAPTSGSHSRNHGQCAAQAARIAAARAAIESVQNQPALLRQLAADGFAAPRLSEGLALQEAAEAAYQQRQAGIGAQRQAKQRLQAARKAARAAYAEFRVCARTIGRDATLQAALTLAESIPFATDLLLVQARAAYTAAGQPEHAAALALVGYVPVRVAAAQATLDELQAAANAAPAIAAQARATTAARDAAAQALFVWMHRFQTVLRYSRRRLDASRQEQAALSPPAVQ